MLKVVVFDLDGTLIDSASFSVSILSSMLRARGSTKVISVSSVQRSLSLGGEALMQDALDASPEAAAQELEAFRAEYQRLPFPHQQVYPSVLETLSALEARGLRLAICTKKPAHLTAKVLEDLGLTGRFEVVSGGDSEPYAKPDPRHLAAVLAKLQVPSSQALFVGDSHLDAQLAAAAGVRFVFAAFGYDEGLVNADECFAVIRQMGELVSVVAAL